MKYYGGGLGKHLRIFKFVFGCKYSKNTVFFELYTSLNELCVSKLRKNGKHLCQIASRG